ncbi:MAG: anti-sigma F factor [Ruminiclostridium sp.]|nr:anti-sigma F factor [Ruminiclostridium sp.]
MKCDNYIKLTVPALSRNESFARAAVGAFVSQLDPTLDELGSVKAAVSEAVTNCIVHAYADSDTIGLINITSRIIGNEIYIKISDKGCGIEDIKKAMEPLFTTKPEQERSGLGFAVMESCCDKVRVSSKKGKGTTVTLIFTVKEKELK